MINTVDSIKQRKGNN